MRASRLFNPFDKIAGFRSLLAGLGTLIITVSVSWYSGTHFNGLLNIDFAKDAPIWIFFMEHFFNWFLTSMLMYISGSVLSVSHVRFVDVAGTTLLSRTPLLIVPLIRVIPAFNSFLIYSWQMYFLNGLYILSASWTIVLLFHSYRVSCNLIKEKLIISFLIIMVIVEISTKLFIKFFLLTL